MEGRFHLNVGICVRDLRQVEAHGANRVDGDGLRGFKVSAGFIGQRPNEPVHALVLEADFAARVGEGAIQLVGQRRGLTVLCQAPRYGQAVCVRQRGGNIHRGVGVGRFRERKRNTRDRIDLRAFRMRKDAAGFVGNGGGQGIAALALKSEGTALAAQRTVQDVCKLGGFAVFFRRPDDVVTVE